MGAVRPWRRPERTSGVKHRIKWFRAEETVVIVVIGGSIWRTRPNLRWSEIAEVVAIIELEGEMLEAEWAAERGTT